MNEHEKNLLFARAGKELSDEDLIVAKAELDASVDLIIAEANVNGLNALANEPYDKELPMSDLVSEIAKTTSISQGVTYQYWVIGDMTKAVHTLVNGLVTQVNVTATSPSTLTFGFYSTPQDYLYVQDMSEAKYDAIAKQGKAQMEAMNRKENKDVLDVAIASAVTAGNTFANTSGDSVIDFPKLVDITDSLAMVGNKLVLISGSTVSRDLRLMDYTEDKNRRVDVFSAGIDKWIKVENYQYTHSTTQTVLAADKLVVVATSDAEDNRPIEFVRRRSNAITGSVEKERVIVTEGPKIHVGANPTLAYSVLTFGFYGVVCTNPACCAVYKKDTSYS